MLRAVSDHLSFFDTLPTEPDAARLPSLSSFNAGGFSGAATYSFPIWTPPGPGGLQPSLSLSYNSQTIDNATATQTQASWVGMGWSLDTGYIERNMHWSGDHNDLYSLVVNGVSSRILKDENGVYHLEDENFWTLSYSGDTWTVRDKEGTVYRFGSEASHAEFKWQDHSGTHTDTWLWPLLEVENKFGKKLTYTYVYEIQNAHCGAPTDYERAVYPEYIYYPNGHYRVSFVLDPTLRTDYRTDWTSTSNCASHLYQRKRLSAIDIQYTATANNWNPGSYSNIRRYTLSYTNLFPGYTWSGGGQTFTLASIQEWGVNLAASLPATTFTYGDNLHLTQADNGYGGRVNFTYEVWHDIDTDDEYKKEYNFDSAHDEDCESWDGSQSSCENNVLVLNGEATHDILTRAFHPGAVFKFNIKIQRKGSTPLTVAPYYGFRYGSGANDYQVAQVDLATINSGSQLALTSYLVLPANAQWGSYIPKWVMKCSSCYVTEFDIIRVPTRYRVTQKTNSDLITGQSQTLQYQYDGGATNDAEHSQAVAQRAAVSDMWGLPYQEPRGHAQIRQLGPLVNNTRQTTWTWFHQDDDYTGQAHTTLAGSQDVNDLDEFFDTLNTSRWVLSHPDSYQVIARQSGDNALNHNSPSYNSSWPINFYRNSYTLSDNEMALVSFRTYGATPESALAAEYGTYHASDYQRWGIYIATDGSVTVSYIDGASDYSYSLNGITIAKDTWYTLLLLMDNQKLYLRIWERENPASFSHYSLASPSGLGAARTWRFRPWINGAGGMYLDEYSEGKLYSMNVSDFEKTDYAKHSSISGFGDLQITWVRPTKERSLAFEGQGATPSGTSAAYYYATASQGGGQYGNLTHTVDPPSASSATPRPSKPTTTTVRAGRASTPTPRST